MNLIGKGKFFGGGGELLFIHLDLVTDAYGTKKRGMMLPSWRFGMCEQKEEEEEEEEEEEK